MAKVQRVTRIHGTATPLHGESIDTDRIIPARYLKVTRFDTLGEFAFYDERFNAAGKALPHPLNDPRFAGASILLVQSNFGSGSSREHAPQALMRYGFRAFVGESFAEIFQGNCLAMGLPVVTLPAAEIVKLLARVEQEPTTEFDLDLTDKRLTIGGNDYKMEMDDGARSALIAGSWDSTSSLLRNRDQIHATAAKIPYLQGFEQ